MKLILPIIILFFSLNLFSQSGLRNPAFVAKLRPEAATEEGNCNALVSQSSDGSSGFIGIGQSAASIFVGLREWISTESTSICEVTFNFSLLGTDISGKTYRIYVYEGGCNHGSLIGSSDLVSGNNSWSSTDVTFSFSTPAAIILDNTYNIAVKVETGEDASNYVSVKTHASPSITGYFEAWNSSNNGLACNQTSAPRIIIKTQ